MIDFAALRNFSLFMDKRLGLIPEIYTLEPDNSVSIFSTTKKVNEYGGKRIIFNLKEGKISARKLIGLNV